MMKHFLFWLLLQVVTTYRTFSQELCADNALRLTGGTTVLEGKLEVCMNATWGGVCHDYWNYRGAAVACRQLGFSRYGAVATFNQETGSPFYINAVLCDGTEQSLFSCQYAVIPTCYSSTGVICQPASFLPTCSENSTRLVGGNSLLEGRVEVCANGDWGTVSHDNWDYRVASVLCRQLGLSPLGSEAIHGGLFGLGTGAIVLDSVRCLGHEPTLTSCAFDMPDLHDSHAKDVGVRCKLASFERSCTEGSIQLTYHMEGSLLVCINGDWGTVNHDRWDYLDSSVVCRELGFSPLGAKHYHTSTREAGQVLNNVHCEGDEKTLMSCQFSVPDIHQNFFDYVGVRCMPGAEATIRSTFGRNETHAIVLMNVQCRSNEEFLVLCPSDVPDQNVYHSEDAGARCQPLSFERTCIEHSVRLVGGTSPLEGRVEVCANGDWGTINHSGWENRDASVVCRQLGFSTTGAETPMFEPGTGAIVYGGLSCRGHETTLNYCNSRLPNYDFHFEDVGARCQPTMLSRNCTENMVRLFGGDSHLEGRVEVCVNGDWGMVTLDGWDYRDAAVACKELGFSPLGAVDIDRAAELFGVGSGSIALSNISCDIRDTNLTSCSSITSLYESDDVVVGVQCHPASFLRNCIENSIRLVGGSSPMEGRVEVCVNGDWGTVTSDEWDDIDATVACRQLNIATFGAVALLNAFFGEGTGAIVLDDVRCQGNETSLSSCGFTIPNIASHSRDAGVRCAARCTSKAMANALQFSALILLEGNGPCSAWISSNQKRKRSDIEILLQEALQESTCNSVLTCSLQITFFCSSPATEEVNLIVNVASTNASSTEKLVQCWSDWAIGDSDGSERAVIILGIRVTIVPGKEINEGSGSSSSLERWIWALVLIFVVAIAAVLALLVTLQYRSMRKKKFAVPVTLGRRSIEEQKYDNPAFMDSKNEEEKSI